MRIIDADGHVAEGASLAVEAMQRWPQHITPRTDGRGLVIEGRHYPEDRGPGRRLPARARAQHGGRHQLLVSRGRAAATPTAITSTRWCSIRASGSVRRASKTPSSPPGSRGSTTSGSPTTARPTGGRLRGVAVTPIEHGDVAIDIMREAKELGLVATQIPPALKTRNLDHPDLDPFYAAAVELDMPLGIHGAPGIHLPKIGVDRFTNYIQVHCISFPFDQMTAMTALVSGGVFDRHPELRVAFLEAGVGWVPFFIDRMHEHFEKRGDWIPNGWRRDPQEYLAGRQHLGDLRAGGADPARRHRRARRRLHHVRQRLPALGRRMAGEHKASAHPPRHQRGIAREDRRT